MTTAQIIVIIIISLVFITSLSVLAKSENEKTKDNAAFLILISFGLITLIACLSLIEANNLLKIKKQKCPEYEKVENVYKLKE
jgi:ABC-type nickel/cobalt efflux system permease component RcnA